MGTTREEKISIFKSTGIVAISQIVILVIGVAKTKIFAVLLGPNGIGLLGLFQSTIDLIRNTSSLGLSFSSVREIAKVKGLEELENSWSTIYYWILLGSITGVIFTIGFSRQLSSWAFGSTKHQFELIFLSITILLVNFYYIRISFLQGIRNIRLYAFTQIISALSGLILSTPFIFIFREKGITISLIVFGLSQYLISWIITRRITPRRVTFSIRGTLFSGMEMIQLGIVTVLSTFTSAITLYLIRIFIAKNASIYHVGIFQAGITISVVYLMALLQAMAADYYPRISAIQNDDKKIVSIANTQIELVVIIGGLLILAMINLLPIVLQIFYSKEFIIAIPMLQWQLLSSFLRIASYPINYILLSKGKVLSYFVVEFLFNLFFLSFTHVFWRGFFMESIGIALAIAYLIYFGGNFYFAKRLINFKITNRNLLLILYYTIAIICTIIIIRNFQSEYRILSSLILFFVALGVTIKYLKSVLNFSKLFGRK